MLYDFSFKIMHCLRSKHSNINALSRNPIGHANEDDDF
jgi:hypothetical protein